MIKLDVLLIGLATTALAACGPEGAAARGAATSDPPAGATAPATSDPSASATEVRAQRLDPAQVPDDLRHLVPVAERWGIGDDVDRNAKVDAATPAERDELATALEPHHARITAWLDSFGQGLMSDEAAAFMYMQLAHAEMRAGNPR
jgi:hypothetical protein